MAAILTPKPDPAKGKITSVSSYLSIIGKWQKEQASRSKGDDSYLGQLWYRGVNQQFPVQVPGVYRPDFTETAKPRKKYLRDLENRILGLERDMLGDFRTAGAQFFDDAGVVDLYFRAQHVGMPTRLLDWSTNPLAALFFACDDDKPRDGVLYAMVAKEIIPKSAWRNEKKGEKLHRSVMSMRHPFVHYAIGLTFWAPVDDDRHPHILPVRPDVLPGRIGAQSSCFTLHMHGAPDAENESLITIPVDAASKRQLREELHSLNINQFTTYHDLDHLSKEIKRCFKLGS